MTNIETQIDQWRTYVERRSAIHHQDVAELESHLRDQIADLESTGLAEDEAFLVAVKRMGSLDDVSREFAREHSDRLWKQLVLTTPVKTASGLAIMLVFALTAAIAVKLPMLVLPEEGIDFFYGRNVSLLVLSVLAGYFAYKRQMSWSRIGTLLVLPIAVLALVMNAYPFVNDGATQILAMVHAPVIMWFIVGIAYCGGDIMSGNRRMDFIRFTGEIVVYFVLIALGGGALLALTFAGFNAIGIDPEWFVSQWIMPTAPAGAVIVAAWLVEAKQSVVENIAPVLTKVFTPITTVMVTALLIATVTVGDLTAVDRDLLILMDVVLVLVLGLLLYAISARDPFEAPTLFDRLQLVLVAVALLADVLMLAAMLWRIAEFGFSPNKVSALGLNLVLAANLLYAGVIGLKFARNKGSFAAVERWQTSYVPMYGAWAAVVVIGLPLLFNFA